MMSTLLEKDLHSVYIDGELPESFVSQYETIVAGDAKEKSRLEKMQVLHSLLQDDSAEKTVSADFMEESFARLQTKMRHAKTISLSSEQKSFVTPFAKYAASFAAAAAVFAVIFVPIHYNSLSNAKETAIAAISIMKEKSIEPIAQKDVVVDGSISKEGLSNGLAVNSQAKSEHAAQVASEADFVASAAEDSASSKASVPQYEQKTIYATNLASTSGAAVPFIREERRNRNSINYQFRQNLPSVDAFAPDFSSSQISITINIPNFHEIGNNIEMMNQQE